MIGNDKKINGLLEASGLTKDCKEQTRRSLLEHLLSAVVLFENMSDVERKTVKNDVKNAKRFFSVNFGLKERRRKGQEREKFPSDSLFKEKETTKEEDEKYIYASRKNSVSLEERKEAFRQECLQYVGQYDNDRLADFFNYFSEPSRQKGKMRFEGKKIWDLESSLKRWMNNHISKDNTAASIRLRRTQKKNAEIVAEAEQQQQAAVVRQQENERREQEREESKKLAISSEDYIAQNPNGILAKMARNAKQ